MQTTYLLLPSNKVYGAQWSNVAVGYPIQEHGICDIAIASINSANFISLNSVILREALLSNPELLEKIGLKVTEISKEQKQEPVKNHKEAK